METPELEEALFQWVTTQPTITTYIGNPPGLVRFFKLRAPQSSKTPACVQQRDGTQTTQTRCGPDGAVLINLRVDHYARSWAEMAALAKAFRRALNPHPSPYPMLMGSGDSPAAQLRVKSATCENEFDIDDVDPGTFRRVQQWAFWVFEP
jgi:hypothetical protein